MDYYAIAGMVVIALIAILGYVNSPPPVEVGAS